MFEPNEERKLLQQEKVQEIKVNPEVNKEITRSDVFPPCDPNNPEIYLFVGKPRSGKSFCVKSIMYQLAQKKHFKFGIAITESKYNGGYNFLPDNCVWGKYSEEKLEKYIMHLRKLREKNKNKQLPPNFIIMDDLLGVFTQYTPFIMNWLSQYRHTNTTIIITAQYLVHGASTLLREFTTYCFMWRTNFKNSIKAMYEGFGALIPKENGGIETFFNILMYATQKKHQCLVFRAGRDTFEESYFTYLANEVPEFKIVFQQEKKNQLFNTLKQK